MRNKSVFIIIGLLLFFNVLAYSQDNFFWIEEGFGTAGSHNNLVNIILANESELGGFQVEIKYDYKTNNSMYWIYAIIHCFT